MRPGPTIISECYKCHKLFRQWTLSSGNTFTAQFLPDGFMKAPMMPEMPPLFLCPSCEGFIWRRDCKEIDEVHGYDEMKEKYPEATGPLIVHRLDMSTSGILVLTKTKEANKILQEQFRLHLIGLSHLILQVFHQL